MSGSYQRVEIFPDVVRYIQTHDLTRFGPGIRKLCTSLLPLFSVDPISPLNLNESAVFSAFWMQLPTFRFLNLTHRLFRAGDGEEPYTTNQHRFRASYSSVRSRIEIREWRTEKSHYPIYSDQKEHNYKSYKFMDHVHDDDSRGGANFYMASKFHTHFLNFKIDFLNL
jgi:hypothetical protein